MNNRMRIVLLGLLSTVWPAQALLVKAAAENYVKKDTWRQTLVANLGSGPSQAVARAVKDFADDRMPLEVVADWLVQDGLGEALSSEAVGRVLDALGPAAGKLRPQFDSLVDSKVPSDDPRWAELYLTACESRRAARFEPYRDKIRQIVFTKHYDLGGSHYAYTEGQSDAQAERHFKAGTALCVLELDGLYGRVRTLLDDPDGVIRDPDVSFDGRRVLFAWKKSLNEDDFHLYEMNLNEGVADGVASHRIRQLTSGLGFADYEGAYLPSGDIVFTSSRCVQIVDCWWTEVSNLFTCDGDGRHMRQVNFDQVHDNYPTVTHDGRVLYTRWDYNDRGQIYPQGLFQMYQDGTGQTEFYGNNSYFPTTVLHARSIPGTGKVLCVFSGHHTRQWGYLGTLDSRMGRQENHGAQLIAPVRDTPAVRIDAYGRNGDQQFQYPYPLSETDFLVTFRLKEQPRFAVYFMTIDGGRELLASDAKVSCNQTVPLCSRTVPPQRPNMVNYRQNTGTVYLQDIYEGPGLEGVEPGTIKRLRVVGLDFRAAGVGSNGNRGPAGGALVSTPISIEGAWDVKQIIGTAKVYDDGSACFIVPARTPVYFQALDEQGQMVQTMRSWMSLQPGETVSCVGCHEHKNSAPRLAGPSEAMAAGPQALTPFYGPPRGFSFVKEIQPVLDRHCIKCHHLDEAPKYAAAAKPSAPAYDAKQFAMVAANKDVPWRYTLEQPAGPAHDDKPWTDPRFDDSSWSYGPGGFGTKGTPNAVVGTTWDTPQIWIRRNFDLPKGFKPQGPMLLAHHDEDMEVYINGVLAAKVKGHTANYGLVPIKPKAALTLQGGTNTLAVCCKQTSGGQFIDVGIVQKGSQATAVVAVEAKPAPASGVEPAFSLRGIQPLDAGAKRKWGDSYRALANRSVASWINVQSAPPMLPPYHAGASQSKLVEMLRDGSHYGLKLSRPELDRFIVWIDLLVPYVGDYTEAMADDGIDRYNHFLEKRRRWHAEEAKNIAEYLHERN